MHNTILAHKRLFLRLVTLLALSIFTCFASYSSHAKDLAPATLKALYTYKFGKFAHWPQTKLNPSTAHFQYCILGQNPFPQHTLNIINRKSVQGIPLTIEAFNTGLVPKAVLSTCHIVFISASEKYRLATILNSLKKDSVLTVSDISDFSSYGGMITLINDLGKLRFQINPQALQQANVSISSKIMELAEIVNEGQQ